MFLVSPMLSKRPSLERFQRSSERRNPAPRSRRLREMASLAALSALLSCLPSVGKSQQEMVEVMPPKLQEALGSDVAVVSIFDVDGNVTTYRSSRLERRIKFPVPASEIKEVRSAQATVVYVFYLKNPEERMACPYPGECIRLRISGARIPPLSARSCRARWRTSAPFKPPASPRPRAGSARGCRGPRSRWRPRR